MVGHDSIEFNVMMPTLVNGSVKLLALQKLFSVGRTGEAGVRRRQHNFLEL